jgi:hypothetical protein
LNSFPLSRNESVVTIEDELGVPVPSHPREYTAGDSTSCRKASKDPQSTKVQRQKEWEPFAEGLIYLEGHELEAFLLAKIRLLVFFRGVILPKFILSTSFENLNFLLVAEPYMNPPRIQKALKCYFECRISWLVLAGWRVPCSYNFRSC